MSADASVRCASFRREPGVPRGPAAEVDAISKIGRSFFIDGAASAGSRGGFGIIVEG
jgi:hypothetical protein